MTVLIFISVVAVTILAGIPISYSLLAAGVALMWFMGIFNPQILAQNIVNGANNFPLLAIPLFLLAGEVMNRGGLSKRIVALAITLVGHRRGGLGYVAVVAAAIIAALSGSAIADAAALTALLLPMMIRAGHDPAKSAGLLASSGIVANIIPPSIAFIIFGVAANVSISRLFMAGIVPGILMCVAVSIAWAWVSRGDDGARQPRATGAQRLAALRESAWALMLPVIVLVGLRMGVFTPTEAAAVAAVYSLFVALVIYRETSLNDLYEIFGNAAKTTAAVMFLIASAMVCAWLLTVANIPPQIVSLVQPLVEYPTLLLLAIVILILVIGAAMDMTPIILIMTPILMPVVRAAGIDPVYFGVLFLMTASIGLITPPVGSVLAVVSGVGRLPFERVALGTVPFLFAHFAVLLLLIFCPWIVMVPLQWLHG